ncbi:MAG TPA: iron-containing redox enzyme family protein [Terriglobales bacterium]|nr:iron-containing redox enzyme family protein [Terriglobales bacterium]
MSAHEQFWSNAKAILAEFDLLKHPFYQAWTCGALTGEDLRFYAGEYYHHVAAFPTYLTAMHSRLPDGALRRQVLANAADEELRGESHSSLWLQFAEAFGADRKSVAASAPAAEIAAVTGSFMTMAREAEPVTALAAFWAYESQVPRVAKEKAAGLRDRYQMGDKACEYFDLHTTVDEFHSQVWASEIEKCLAAGANVDDALVGVRTAATQLWKALDFIESTRQQKMSGVVQ